MDIPLEDAMFLDHGLRCAFNEAIDDFRVPSIISAFASISYGTVHGLPICAELSLINK